MGASRKSEHILVWGKGVSDSWGKEEGSEGSGEGETQGTAIQVWFWTLGPPSCSAPSCPSLAATGFHCHPLCSPKRQARMPAGLGRGVPVSRGPAHQKWPDTTTPRHPQGKQERGPPVHSLSASAGGSPQLVSPACVPLVAGQTLAGQAEGLWGDKNWVPHKAHRAYQLRKLGSGRGQTQLCHLLANIEIPSKSFHPKPQCSSVHWDRVGASKSPVPVCQSPGC